MPLLPRFDGALMAPPTPQPVADAAGLARVRAWCERGALPRMTTSFDAASIAPQAGLDGIACELDGSHRLARLGRARGLAWRLQVLLNDRRPGRAFTADDPWDCGWWREGPLDAAEAFRPRRATLLLVHDGASTAALLDTLRRRSAGYARPLRVLVASASGVSGLPAL